MNSNSNVKNKIVFIALIVLFMLGLLSIKNYAVDNNFSLDVESKNVSLNGSIYLNYSGGSGTVTWTSSDSTIATVENGKVSGLKIGTATITATRGTETASCTVNVVYSSLTIGGNAGKNVSTVNLILGEHASETLLAKVEDGKYSAVSNAKVTWTSSDTSIVTVDSSKGTITAVKPGTAKITVTAAGVTDSCDVTVYAAPTITDFSKAKYETDIDWSTETLKITGIKPNTDDYTYYYYIVTTNSSKPNIAKNKNGSIDMEKMGKSLERLYVNSDENYLYSRKLSKYAELNKDIHIWVLQETKLGDNYYDENSEYTSYTTKFVVEDKKITKAELPKLNLILQGFNIGKWNSSSSNESENYTYIKFNFPSDTEKRKFKIKVGKVTDNSILSKIQNNNYAGITELLAYAKRNNAVYSQTLTTTDVAYYKSETALFDGKKLLENKAYYYIYVEFDDENGKYVPIEGVTLGQAYFSSTSDSWNLWAYTSSDFNWDGLKSTQPEPTDKKDQTVADKKIPQTGVGVGAAVSIIILTMLSLFTYFKYNKLKEI